MHSTIIAFAEKYRLRVRRDVCGDSFVPGRFGTISDYGADLLALSFLADANDKGRDNTLRSRIRRALAAGFQPSQVGDYEAVLLFEGSDQAQVRAAMKLAGIKRRRHQGGKGKPLNSERARYLAQIRHGCAREGHEEVKSAPIQPRDKELVTVGV